MRVVRLILAALVVLVLWAIGWALATYSGWTSWPGWGWPGWSAVTGLATLAAVVVALALGIWSDELEIWGSPRPHLGLTLDPVPDHFQKFLTEAGPMYTVRISVTNEGRRPARNVELWAQELRVEQQGGAYVRDPAFMAMNLIRTHSREDASPKVRTVTPVVHPGIPKPYDVGKVLNPDLSQAARRKELLFEISTEVGPVKVEAAGLKDGIYPSWKPPGRYRLVLAIAADGVDVIRRVVEISWTGRWDDDPDAFFKNELHVALTS